jgi:hypothetical protein
MGKIIKERLLSSISFWVCLCTSLVLIALGFLGPPVGDIHPSVLTAVGELFGFATVAVVADAIKFGYDAKITHGNTTVQIGDGVKED